VNPTLRKVREGWGTRREELWDDLQYVMSDPKADLVPAKRKLIQINLAKAGEVVRESIIEIVAKTTAELLRG
jgi:hypothetical protein